jgi:uncharacterized protein (DUF1330 family)
MPAHIVIIDLEPVEAARRWYHSPESTAINGLRTSTRMDGLPLKMSL